MTKDFVDRAMNTKDAADYLGLAPKTLENMRAARRGPRCSKVGGRVMYRLKDLVRYLELHEIVSDEDAQAS